MYTSDAGAFRMVSNINQKFTMRQISIDSRKAQALEGL